MRRPAAKAQAKATPKAMKAMKAKKNMKPMKAMKVIKAMKAMKATKNMKPMRATKVIKAKDAMKIKNAKRTLQWARGLEGEGGFEVMQLAEDGTPVMDCTIPRSWTVDRVLAFYLYSCLLWRALEDLGVLTIEI